MNDDTISRQAAIDKLKSIIIDKEYINITDKAKERIAREFFADIPSAQSEQHYCRECKWSRCYINVDKYGKSEIYWRCLIWDAETDEEGYCHEWKRRQS